MTASTEADRSQATDSNISKNVPEKLDMQFSVNCMLLYIVLNYFVHAVIVLFDHHGSGGELCGERRLYLSCSANAGRTLSHSTRSSLFLSWPATPQSGSSLYILMLAGNIFSLILVLNWSTSLHFAAPPTSVDIPTPFHRLTTVQSFFQKISCAYVEICFTRLQSKLQYWYLRTLFLRSS